MYQKLASLCIVLIFLLGMTGCQSNHPNNHDNANEHTTKDTENNRPVHEVNTEIVTRSNEVGFQLMNQLTNEDEKENIFISPISLYMTLSMVYSGATDETKEEIASLLGVKKMTTKELNEANLTLLETLNKENEDSIELEIANSLWIDHQFQLNEDYQDMLDHYFHGKASTIDGTSKSDVRAINEWVSKITNGNIKEVAKAPLGDDFVAMLINTVYFNGEWSYPFNEEDTDESTFYLPDRAEIEVPFMKLEKKLSYVKREGYEAVKLPYGEDGKLGMYVYLPEENGDLAFIHEAFFQKGATHMLAEMEQREGTVFLPKFTIEYDNDMTEILQELGMKRAFDEDGADFPKIIDNDAPLHISEVKQKAYLDVDEAGTEAAGSTSIGMETTSLPVEGPFDMKVDRPFVMLIVDEETGTVLFAGDIWEPS